METDSEPRPDTIDRQGEADMITECDRNEGALEAEKTTCREKKPQPPADSPSTMETPEPSTWVPTGLVHKANPLRPPGHDRPRRQNRNLGRGGQTDRGRGRAG